MTEQVLADSKLTAKNASIAILIIAILVSGYLSYLKIASQAAVCIEGAQFDCGTVLNSIYSEIQGVPIAWLGLAANIIMISLLLLENRIAFLQRYSVLLVFAVSLFTFVYSMYLIYVQAVLILAYCPWCLSHEAFMTIMFGLSIRRITQWELLNPKT